MKTVWTVIDVKYDHFRFEELLFIGSKEKCLDFIEKKCGNVDILQYNRFEIDPIESIGPNSYNHIWLDSYKVGTEILNKAVLRARSYRAKQRLKEKVFFALN